jgi:replicative DNA helicase
MRFRDIGIRTNMTSAQVRRDYENKHPSKVGSSSHLYYWKQSALSPESLENAIINSELVIGAKPDIAIIDYLQLMVLAKSSSRYETYSQIIEAVKRVAVQTDTIIIVGSQTQRPAKGQDPVMDIHAGKETGSIENSATLVFGMERIEYDQYNTRITILKYTNGYAGKAILCNLKPSLEIKER